MAVVPVSRKLLRQLNKLDNGCWEFTGARTGEGYGAIWDTMKRRQFGAHVVSYEFHCGPVPQGMFVLHSCDNPPCCNPQHLFLGTSQSNKDDEVNKKRYVYGIKHGHVKLNEESVGQIKVLLKDGTFTQDTIGAMFGVTGAAVSRIAAGLNWRHLWPI